ncbi:MAG: type II toxin-antitoxin system VapC family toxin [Collimonas sp.]|uniref:type II toxin-antitoxin system VapC family toxin n=1 Tax=Collimonas sp. TaxID=1963772 RepID=UPI003264E446
MTLIIDASMALAWIYAREKPAEAACADRALQASIEVAMMVPSLWHTEIANALLVGERRKIITEAQTIDYLMRLSRLPIAVDDVLPASRQEQVMALARQYSLTAYDATYLELALRMGATLATFDGKLATAMQGAGGKLFT